MSLSTDDKIELEPNEKERMQNLLNTFSKIESNHLQLSEFLYLSLDRGFFSNRIGYLELTQLFQRALEEIFQVKVTEKKLGKDKSSPIKQSPTKGAVKKQLTITDQKQEIVSETKKNALNIDQFTFLGKQLAKILYPAIPTLDKFSKFFQDFLRERLPGEKKDVSEQPRVMMMDDTNKKLLMEKNVLTMCEYQKDLQQYFTLYVPENLALRKQVFYNHKHFVRYWKENMLQNKTISAFGTIKFLKEASIVPDYISLEATEEILIKICPAMSAKEHYFYSEGKLSKYYDSETLAQDQDPKPEGQPQLHFYEFLMFLTRLGVEIGQQKFGGSQDKTPLDIHIKNFFDQILCIRNNEQFTNNVPISNLNRKIFNYCKQSELQLIDEKNQFKEQQTKQQKYQQFLQKRAKNVSQDEEVQFLSDEDEKLLLQEIQEKHNKKYQFQERPGIQLDYQQILVMLESELPELPEEYQVKQDDINKQAITIGEKKPKPPPDKNKPKQKPMKKQQKKKGEPEPRPIIWQTFPMQTEDNELQLIQQKYDSLQFKEPLVSDFEKASMSYIDVAPCIIREVIYPLDVPPPVRTFIEAGILAHNNKNYNFALENYEIAKKKWQEWLRGADMTFQQQLFFYFSQGQVYESAGRDDYALERFIECKKLNENFPLNAPDRALAFSGIGSSLFNMEEYEYSARSYLKAREIREELLGKDAPDTATIYNNLGCCMMMLERNIEAYAYFKLATAIFETELGVFHFRTQQVSIQQKKIYEQKAQRNLKKCCKQRLHVLPEYKQAWEAFVDIPFMKVKKAKKKKKKS